MSRSLKLSETERKIRQAAACKRWRERNPEKSRAVDRVKKRDTGLRRRYGITTEQFNQLLVSQNHRCAICRSDDPKGRGTFHVDHCHDTGKIRGLLCSTCNQGIGLLKHNLEILKAAAVYLEQQNGD